MTENFERRQMLQGGAVLLTIGFGAAMSAYAKKSKTVEGGKKMDTVYAPSGEGVVTGKGVGDFDFLAGNWHIRHQRLKPNTEDDWLNFESSASVHRVLGGMASIEELRNADGSNMGMAVRVWLPESKAWADHWTSAANGIVNAPQLGSFIDGDGVFISYEDVDGISWQYRGVWDKITPESCRWHQSASKDGGKSWSWNWWMEWTRQS